MKDKDPIMKERSLFLRYALSEFIVRCGGKSKAEVANMNTDRRKSFNDIKHGRI